MNDRHRIPKSLSQLLLPRISGPEQDSAYRPTPESPPHRIPLDFLLNVGDRGQIAFERRRVNRNKYLAGLIGLAVGFIISFFWTQSINKAGASKGVAASGPQAGASGEMSQQAMMGQVQQVIEHA